MKISELLLKIIPSSVFVFSIFNFAAFSAFAGGPTPGDGGVQIVFGDDGAGGTRVTATGIGQTDDDADSGNAYVGFLDGIEVDTLHPNVPPSLASLSDIPRLQLTDTLEFSWAGLGSFTYEYFDIDGGGGASQGAFFEKSGGGVNVPIGGAEMTVTDGTGTIPLQYSTFATVHGMSFPTTDGFTFVFEGSAATQAAACADKSALLRKIKKLKKSNCSGP